MEKPIVVLGASGKIGSVAAHLLLNKHIAVRVVGRNAENLKVFKDKGAEIREGTFDDQQFLNDAFKGSRAAFVLTPGDISSPDLHEEQRRYSQHITEAIRNSHITHVVFLSSWGAELSEKSSTIYGCYLFEQMLNQIPDLHVVHLRSVWFMDNFIFNIGLIKMAGINGLSIDPGFPFPCIDCRDIGTIVADYLSDLSFRDKNIHYLQGPKNYTMTEVTRILGTAIGKPKLKYYKFSPSMMMQGLKSSGMISDDVARLLVETNEKINSGRVLGEERSAQNTTPTSLEEFALEKFRPAYLESQDVSLWKKMQGAFLRLFLSSSGSLGK